MWQIKNVNCHVQNVIDLSTIKSNIPINKKCNVKISTPMDGIYLTSISNPEFVTQ